MPDIQPTSMESAFIDGLTNGLPIKTAALNAGYSQNVAESAIYTKLRSPSFASKVGEYLKTVPTARKQLALLRIPDLLDIERNILDVAKADPEYALKASKTIEREYRLAGLLQDEQARPQVVQIGTINVIQQALSVLYDDDCNVPVQCAPCDIEVKS